MFKDDDEADTNMGAVRYPVMPSLMALQQMRNRLHLAQLGKKLMKWTAMATLKELRRLAGEILQLIRDYDVKVRTAFIYLARARYFVPQMNGVVLESIPLHACVTVKQTARSVSGVKVKDFNVINHGCDSYLYLGMSQGGIQIKKCKEIWLQLVKQMVLICQYRVTFELIEAANKNATKKQNVLQRCILPKITITMTYVLSELDEMEREENFRLKRFKQLKQKKETERKMVKEKPPPPPPPAPVRIPVPAPKPVPERISEPEINPLDLLMMHINKVIDLAGQLESEDALPEMEFGLTKCDLVGLKMQLSEIVKLNDTPIKNRVCDICGGLEMAVSKCSCPNRDDTIQKEPIAATPFDITTLVIPMADIPPDVTPTGDIPPVVTPTDDIPPVVTTTGDIHPAVTPTAAVPPAVTPTTAIPPAVTPTAVIPPVNDADEKLITNYKMPVLDNISEPRSVCVAKSATASHTRLEDFETYVDKVVDITFNYHGEGLLSDPEEFVRACKAVKDRIQQYRDSRKVKAKIERLKEQVANLETMTDIVQQEILSSTSITSFLTCCKDFKNKLDYKNVCQGPQQPLNSIENLITQINDSILLSKEAKKEGYITHETLDAFIENCNEMKDKILTGPEKPPVIEKLLVNIDDILGYLSQHNVDGPISESIESFYNSCILTKTKLNSKKRSEREVKVIPPKTYSTEKHKMLRACGLVPPHRKPPPRTPSPEKIEIKKVCGGKPPSKTPSKTVSITLTITPSKTSTKTPSKTPSKTSTKTSSKNPSDENPQTTMDPNDKSVCYIPTIKTANLPLSFGGNAGGPAPSLTKSVECFKNANSYMAEQPSLLTPHSSEPTLSPCSRTTCTQCTHGNTTPQISKSAESIYNSCTEISKSPSVPKNKYPVRIKKDQRGYYEHTVSTVIKRLQEEDGSIIENSETVTVRQRILDSQQRPVTSQKSFRCTKQVNVCDGPLPTEGFIQTVKNIKSACDLSHPFIPVVWSSISLDTGQQKYNDPFFCGSPTISDKFES